MVVAAHPRKPLVSETRGLRGWVATGGVEGGVRPYWQVDATIAMVKFISQETIHTSIETLHKLVVRLYTNWSWTSGASKYINA